MKRNTKDLQEWIKKRYYSIREKFKNDSFKFDDVSNALFNLYKDSPEQTKLILSELKRAGLLETTKNPEDRRESIYQVVDILEPLPLFEEHSKLSKDHLTNILKTAADIIRTRVDYTFILLLLFYKALSDKWKDEYETVKEELTKKGLKEKEVIKEAAQPCYHTFHFKNELLWDEIRKEPLKLPENLSKSLKELAELNPDYKDIFSHFDFHQFTSNQENHIILNNLFELFSRYSFEKVEEDILGDAYEWILKYFAPTKAKEGEVYTPREVIRLMIEILDPKPGKWIYDPACGSAGMLIVAYQYVKEKYGKDKSATLFLYGQEYNSKTLALAKMNAVLHRITNIVLSTGDTLLFPKFKEKDSIKQFDYVIANPPWNQDGYDEDTLQRGEYYNYRFPFGAPTKQSADWAWIQHMISSANDKGRVAVVIDTGAVSRGGREKEIRKKVLEKDIIESVILLPEKIFYNTGAPAVILVFNKNKPKENKEKILLINASKEFIPGKAQNFLGKEHIEKIVKTYKEFKEIEKFSRIINRKEIEEVDYNLSPSRFISVFEEENYRDIKEIKDELRDLEKEREEIERRVNKILDMF
ncbi:MAG: type I restriction-modification system subunit M [Candidatus Omnitrophica bacterium]|nr:type I restriction-modification system subunit M [Candidatus Omnitrophota bacterium]